MHYVDESIPERLKTELNRCCQNTSLPLRSAPIMDEANGYLRLKYKAYRAAVCCNALAIAVTISAHSNPSWKSMGGFLAFSRDAESDPWRLVGGNNAGATKEFCGEEAVAQHVLAELLTIADLE